MSTVSEIKAAILEAGFEHVVVEESRTQEWGLDSDIITNRREFVKTQDGLELECSLTESLGFSIGWGNNKASNAKDAMTAIELAIKDLSVVDTIDDNEILEF